MLQRHPLTSRSTPVTGRDPALVPTDISALRALAQAALNVELFTIPLYMSTMYSITGTHEINAKGINYYNGRFWPGAAPSAHPHRDPPGPMSGNPHAFNVLFSVFIEEMLHLQMAANLCTAIGLQPTFTGAALQDPQSHSWHCYGPHKTVIPHIVDLRDTIADSDVVVNLGPLDADRIKLLLVIEMPHELAMENIRPDKRARYESCAPFADWQPGNTENELPLFGSIGHLYQCYADYLQLEYSDGSTLWHKVYDPKSIQRDLFNNQSKPGGGHPEREYPGFWTTLTTRRGKEDTHLSKADILERRAEALKMIHAITDQGEGSLIKRQANQPNQNDSKAVGDVYIQYSPSREALEGDYPSYDSTGHKLPDSADAAARFQAVHPHAKSELDHYQRYHDLQKALDAGLITTWDRWRPGVTDKWTKKDLCPDGNEGAASPLIPKPQEVADALNRFAARPSEHRQLSEVCVGSLAGITTVMNQYWSDASVSFPMPSMVGSGDRVSLCWAIFGRAPDLSVTLPARPSGVLHACQGLDFGKPGHGQCAHVAVFHTCKGSNGCRAQGGCGFVHAVSGGGNCSQSAGSGCGGNAGSGDMSAPSDNKCGGFGGCAVPISASQLYPTAGQMQLFHFPGGKSEPLPDKLSFKVGDSVYATAWKALREVLKANHEKDPGEAPPKPEDLRLVFPPST